MKLLHLMVRRLAFVHGLAVCSILAASCSSGGSDHGGQGGASGSIGEGGLAQGSGGNVGAGGVPLGSGGSVGEGGVAQGSGGSLAQGGGGSLDAGTGGLAQGSGGSLAIGTGGVVGGAGGGLGTALDGGQEALVCSLGADPADCQLCQSDIPASCERPCPKVDCSVYPPPAECEAVCAGAKCCECQRSFGNEHFWRAPLAPIKCGTACTDMIARWTTLVSGPAITACTVDADCVVVGGGGSCQCVAALSGCGKAVNSVAYQTSGAADIVGPFLRDCQDASRACDCGLPSAGCKSGQCVITGYVGCGIGIDAGPPRG